MPSKKPTLQVLMDYEYSEKFEILCKKTKRSKSNMAQRMIEKYIDDYETENGPIITGGGGLYAIE